MSFTAKVYGERGDLLWLVTGVHKARKAWWFVMVSPAKINSFKAALGSDMVLTEYGEIITSGYGEKPEASDIEEIKAKGFKVNDDVVS